MTVRAAPLLNDPRKHVMVDFYDQNSAMNSLCSVYLLVAQPITIGGEIQLLRGGGGWRTCGTVYVGFNQ